MRTGIDRNTGKVLQGWDHCVQSIGVIITTRIGWTYMLRSFGCDVGAMQDDNPAPREMMLLFGEIARALRTWEPGFRLQTIAMTRLGPDGVYKFELGGVFYPRGHLGDFSLAEERSTALPVAANSNGFVILEQVA